MECMKRILVFLLLCCFTLGTVFSQAVEKTAYYTKYYNCVFWNNKKRAQRLIDKGYSIDSRSEEGISILMYCLKTDNEEWAEFFIDAGADMNLADPNGNTPLHYAVENTDNHALIKKMVEKGASPDVPNNQLYTPFHYSILFACPDLPFYFIEQGVNYKRITAINENAVHLSLEAGCDTLTNYLLKQNINLFLKDNNGNTPLITALHYRRVEQASQLIDLGADVNMKDGEGLSCLFLAIANLDTVNFEKMLDVGVKLDEDTLLLRQATEVENKTMIRDLLKHGVSDSLSGTRHEDYYDRGLVYWVKAENTTTDEKKIAFFKRSIQEFNDAKILYRRNINNLELDIVGKELMVFLFDDEGYSNAYDQLRIERDYYLEQIRKCNRYLTALKDSLEKMEAKDDAEKVIEL